MCFPPSWEASWAKSNAKPPEELENKVLLREPHQSPFYIVQQRKPYQKLALSASEALLWLTVGHYCWQKKWPWRQQSSTSPELREVQWCLPAVLPEPIPPKKQYFHWGGTASALEPASQPWISQHLSPQGWGSGNQSNRNKWGLTRDKPELTYNCRIIKVEKTL